MRAQSLLFVDHAAALGGAERSLLLLLERLGQFGWQPHLACVPGDLAMAARDTGVPVHVVELPRLRGSASSVTSLGRNAQALAELARKLDAVAIYANTVRAAVHSAVASQLARRAFIWHMRDFWLSEERPARLWLDFLAKRLLLLAARGVIANSEAVAHNLPPTGKVRVVLNGTDVEKFVGAGERRTQFRGSHGLPPDALLVGMVGRLRPWKGQERFLRVARRVADRRDDAYFVITGGSPFGEEGDYAASLHGLAKELGIASRVLFTGQVDDVRTVLPALDLFVHPGDPEPFGLVNVEAMATGLALVAFAHGALPEIVVDSVTGKLVAPGDEEGMAQAILELLHDQALRRRMGDAGRERAVTVFSIDRTVQEVDDALRWFLRVHR